jgi:peptide/nickel transport system permease protein
VTVSETAARAAPEEQAADGEGARLPWRAVWRALWGPREGKLGLAILTVFLLMVVFGPAIAPYSPYAIGVGIPNTGPSSAHLLGCDDLGRDIFSRLLCGARSVILAPLAATILAFAIGGLIGLIVGYRRGLADTIATRGIDVFLALPPLLIVLVVIAAAGTSTVVIVLSVALVYSPRVARVLRGATQGVSTQEYIQAAQARGEGTTGIVLRELLPNITPTVLVEFAVRLTYVIIFITTLNFLGLGVQPPSPNWGRMLFEARTTIVTNPIAAIAPAVALGALSVSIGLIADAVTRSMGLEEEGEFLR